MDEQLDLNHEIREEVIVQLCKHVVLHECTVEEACEEIGIPYSLALANKTRDERLSALWKFQRERQDQKQRLATATPKSFRDVTEIQTGFVKQLFERAGLGEKMIRYVEKIDADTDEGDEKIEKLIRFGFLKQVLPTQSMSHQSKAAVSREDELEQMTTAELIHKVKERHDRLNELLGEREAATRARERHAGLIEEGDPHVE